MTVLMLNNGGDRSSFAAGKMDSPSTATKFSPRNSSSSTSDDGFQFLAGLIVAGMASTLLTTIFGIFHVDTFLSVFELPLNTFATGNFIFSFINTANDVAGAWLVDVFASSSSRSSIIGISGCIFALSFLSPFFRWNVKSSHLQAGFHFVMSMSLYDTMYSFMAILMGSVLTDNHKMRDAERINFLGAAKVVNLVASFLVARIGLSIFTKSNIQPFQTFVVGVCVIVCGLFLLAQCMMNPEMNITSWSTCRYRRVKLPAEDDDDSSNGKPTIIKRKLRLKQVVKDFLSHKNFLAWIGMEMLLECQQNFVSSWTKTFIDRLVVVEHGLSQDASEWLLSLLHPMRQVCGILMYLPIRQIGYAKIYKYMFRFNLLLASTTLLVASPSRPFLILTFLIMHSCLTGAVQSAGFHLAMSDMVLEMKRKHAVEGRMNEPSLAGLFMGANALLCKPMESVLPILAAWWLNTTDFSQGDSMSSSLETRQVLFYLLVLPVLVCSSLQLWSWRKYNLYVERTESMREELHELTTNDEKRSTTVELVA